MDRPKRIVQAFLNSAEGYFHKRRIIQDQVKQPRDLYGPENARPERWNYTDIRNITKEDLDIILEYSLTNLDQELYQAVPSVALNTSLQSSIHDLFRGKYQSKIDARTYVSLLKILALKAKDRGSKYA